MRRHLPLAATLAVLALFGGYALVGADPYLLSVLSTVLIYAVAVSGLNLLAGYGGYLNLSQATFMGIGAYTAAFAVNRLGMGFWEVVVLGPVAAALVASVLAVPLLRLQGQYFAIATLLLCVVFTTVMQNVGVLGGSIGIGGFVQPFTAPAAWFLFLLAVTAVLTAGTAWVARRPLGRHLDALRQDESLSESIGIAVHRRKYQAFVIGAAIGGLAGVLLAYNAYFIAPDLFNFFESFLVFVALIVGGAGTVVGPLLGALFLVGLPEAFRFAQEARYLFMGIAFVLVMGLAPDGVAGALRRLAARLARARRRPDPPPPVPRRREPVTAGAGKERGDA